MTTDTVEISQELAQQYKAFYEFMVSCDMQNELMQTLIDDHRDTPIDGWDSLESWSELYTLCNHILYLRGEMSEDDARYFGFVGRDES